MPRRVAITIAGAVSLGSYEAGVIYELLEAFRSHNAKAHPDEKIYVDVLTGASAGGMTAAMLGQRLMFDGATLGVGDQDECAFTNPLYHAWVERIDIRELVDMEGRERCLVWHSLFSSDLIETIGNEMLVESMASPTLSGPHSVVELDADGKPKPIDVGVAITNLNGVNYTLSIPGSDDQGFNYTTSVDQQLFTLKPEDQPDAGKWQILRQAAVSCGAFPAAFRPQPIVRNSVDYKVPKRPINNDPPMNAGCTYIDWGASDPRTFAYCDGGVLQNQPLGIAKNFVDDRVKKAQDRNDPNAHELADDRLYVFVSPHAVLSSANDKIDADRTTIVQELIALFYTYVRQASFHDWITAEGVNAKINVLDTRATDLCKLILKNGPDLDIAALSKASSQLNNLLVPDLKRREQTFHRLSRQYASEFNDILKAHGEDSAKAFINAVETLETAAELGIRDKMKIVAVIADGRTELAGSPISAFVGFFDQEFRKHDYWMGRVKTRVYLQRQDVKRILKVGTWPREATWGGKTEDQVKAVLKNPTKIDKLPLTPGQMLKPGLKSLLWMVLIRPQLIWCVLGFLLLAGVAVWGVVCLIAHHFRL